MTSVEDRYGLLSDAGRSLVHRNYANFTHSAVKDQELRRQMAAKALDIPYDAMGDITVTHNSSNGSGLATILAVGCGMLGLGGAATVAGLFLAGVLQFGTPPPSPEPAPVEPSTPETRTITESVQIETRVIPPGADPEAGD